MARKFGKLLPGIWSDPKFLEIGSQARRNAFVAYLYLISSPHTNMVGCFRLPLGYAVADLGALGLMTHDEIAGAFDELEEARFITRCPEFGYVLIRGFFKHNQFDNMKHAKGALALVRQVEVDTKGGAIFRELLAAIERYRPKYLCDLVNGLETVSEPFGDGFDTVSEQSGKGTEEYEYESESESESESEQESEMDGGAPADARTPAATSYAWKGRVIRLVATDYEAWKKAYPHIELDGRLQSRDDWLATQADAAAKKDWFRRTSAWLSKINDEAASDRRVADDDFRMPQVDPAKRVLVG